MTSSTSSQTEPPRLQINGGWTPSRWDCSTDRFYAFLAAAVIVGAVLRFSTLTHQSFWFDEGATWLIVSRDFGHVISTVPKTESTPWTYYAVLWVWTRIFGIGEAGLRSLSAVCGLATIWIDGLVGRRLISNRAGIAAAALTAVSPIMIWYSQEARAYAMLVTLSALSLLLLLRATAQPTSRRLLAWAVTAAVAISVHYYAAFAVAPQALWLLGYLHRRALIRPRQIGAVIALPLVTGLALLPLVLHQDDGRAASIAGSSLLGRVATLLKEDVVGPQIPFNGVFKLLGGILVVIVFWLVVFRADEHEKRALRLPLLVGIGALGLAVAAAVAGFDFVNTRNMLVFWPALVVFFAGAVGVPHAAKIGPLSLVGLCAVSLACVIVMAVSPFYQRDNWRGVAAALGAEATSRRVIVGDVTANVALAPFMPRMSLLRSSPAHVKEVDFFALAEIDAPPVRTLNGARLPGFRLVRRIHSQTFTVLRYRASAPLAVTRAALLPLGLQKLQQDETVLQQAR